MGWLAHNIVTEGRFLFGALNEEQQNEYAACGNGITLGNIHGNHKGMEEGGKVKCFGERNSKDLKVQGPAIYRAELLLIVFQNDEGRSRKGTYENKLCDSNPILFQKSGPRLKGTVGGSTRFHGHAFLMTDTNTIP